MENTAVSQYARTLTPVACPRCWRTCCRITALKSLITAAVAEGPKIFDMHCGVTNVRVSSRQCQACRALQTHPKIFQKTASSARRPTHARLTTQAVDQQDDTSTEASRAEARQRRRETRDATDTTVVVNPVSPSGHCVLCSSGLQSLCTAQL